MSGYPAGAENDPNAPYNEVDERECSFCGTPTSNKYFCSKECEIADLND